MHRSQKVYLTKFIRVPRRTKDGKALLYVRPKKHNKISSNGIEEFCHNHLALPLGEFKRVFIAFQEAAKWYLGDGMTVETPIGTFSPTLRLRRRRETDPKKITANDIYFDTINFTPNKDFLLAVTEHVRGFHKSNDLCGNSQMYDQELMLATIINFFDRGNNMITIRQFQALSNLRYHSARRCLEGFCGGDHPILRRSRMGSTLIYQRI